MAIKSALVSCKDVLVVAEGAGAKAAAVESREARMTVFMVNLLCCCCCRLATLVFVIIMASHYCQRARPVS